MATTPILPSDFIFFDQVNSTTALPPGNYAANVSTDIDLGSSFNQTQGNICEPINNPPLIITAGIISMAVIIGNGLVILAIIGGNSRFFRPMYWFIVHLSFSDLLVGLMLLWNYCLAGIFNINNTLTSLSFLFGIWVTSACCSVFGILLLAIDRYMQVVHKALHKLYFNQFTVGLSIFLSWLIPLLGFLVIPISLNLSCKDTCRCIEGKYMECKPVTICSQIIPPYTKNYVLAVAMYLFLIMPWPILIYSLIFIKARRSTQVLRQKLRTRDIRLIHTLVVIMVVLIVTITPSGVILIIDYSKSEPDSKLVDYTFYIVVIATLNSLANPVLYIWRITAIRVSLQRRFWCFFSPPKHPGIESRSSRIGKKTTDRFNSDVVSVDVSEANHRPTERFLFCGRTMFTSNVSDISQESTPDSQRGSAHKSPWSRNKHGLSVELQPVLNPKPSTHSPLCQNVVVEEVWRENNSHLSSRSTFRTKRVSSGSNIDEELPLRPVQN